MKLLSSLVMSLLMFQLHAAPGDAFLNPANFISLGNFNPSQNVLIDMNTGQMSGGASFVGVNTTQAGTALLVFTFSSFNLDTGITITFTNGGTGTRAVGFLSQGNMMIHGVIRANGESGITFTSTTVIAKGGPGGSNAVEGTGKGSNATSFFLGGGGGGGYGGAGGRGGYTSGGAGGITYNSDLSSQVIGGSGGGHGGYSNANPGLGAGGGGALHLAALGTLTISGTVTANGGTGGKPSSTFGNGGGGGGGSGGAILIHAGNVTIGGTAVVTASGGPGGSSNVANADVGGGGGGGGRVHLAYRHSGTTNTTPIAAGGNGGYGGVGYPGNSGSYGTNGVAGTVVFEQNALVPALPGPLTLTMNRSGNQLQVSWSAAFSDAVLENSPALGPDAQWTTVPTTGTSAWISAESGMRFFRLRIP